MGSSQLLHQQARGLLSRNALWRPTPCPACSSSRHQSTRSQHQWQQEQRSSGTVRAAAATSETSVLEADSRDPATVEEVPVPCLFMHRTLFRAFVYGMPCSLCAAGGTVSSVLCQMAPSSPSSLLQGREEEVSAATVLPVICCCRTKPICGK